MALLRKAQLAAIAEDYEGIFQAMVAADLKHVLVPASVEYALAQIDRNTARGNLTMPVSVPSFREAKIDFTVEPSGAIAGIATVPQIDLFLRACGMKRVAVKRVVFAAGGTPSAAIQHLATFLQATSGATGIIYGDRMPGDNYMFFQASTGTVDAAHTITFTNPDGSTPTASTINSGFALVDAYAWVPEDRMLSSIAVLVGGGAGLVSGNEIVGATSGARGIANTTISGTGTLVLERFLGSPHFVTGEQIQNVAGTSNYVTGNGTETQTQVPSLSFLTPMDGTFRKAMKGARGSWKARLKNGDRPLFDFSFRGCGTQPADGINLAWPGDTMKVPNVVTGGRFLFDVTYPANFSELSVDFGAEVNLREAPGDTTGTGYESALITGRDCKGQVDPETIRESIYAFKAQDKAWNKTPFRIAARCGPGADANTFEVWTRRTQIGTPKEGERAGILSSTWPLMFRGDGNDEVIVFLS